MFTRIRATSGKRQLACKPGSVWPQIALRRDDHSSWVHVTVHLTATYPDDQARKQARHARAHHVIPIRSCSRWGLPCRFHCWPRGGLLLHLFTLTLQQLLFLRAKPTMPFGRFAFCCTFPGVAPAGRYPAPCFHGARTFLPAPSFDIVQSDRPASWQKTHRKNRHVGQSFPA